jgi:hypothetical protein
MAILASMIGLHGVGATLPVPTWLPDRLGAAGAWLQAHDLIRSVGAYAQGGAAFRELGLMAALYAIVWSLPNSQQLVGLDAKGGAAVLGFARRTLVPAALQLSVPWGVVTGIVAVAAILGIGAKSEFLYFQF